jgi:hypothetical protein
MRAIAILCAILPAAARAETTGGISAIAGPGWNDYYHTHSLAFGFRGQIGVRPENENAPRLGLMATAQVQRMSVEGTYHEAPEWESVSLSFAPGVQFEYRRFALLGWVGLGVRLDADPFGKTASGLAYGATASFVVVNHIRAEIGATRWELDQAGFDSRSATSVTAGLGISF